MVICAIVSCKSLFLKDFRRLFSPFPVIPPFALCVWKIAREQIFDPENARICSEHYREDYDESFVAAQALSSCPAAFEYEEGCRPIIQDFIGPLASTYQIFTQEGIAVLLIIRRSNALPSPLDFGMDYSAGLESSSVGKA